MFDVVAIYYRQNFVLLVHNEIMNRQFYEHKTATIINYNYNHFFCQTYKHLKALTMLVFNVKILIKKTALCCFLFDFYTGYNSNIVLLSQLISVMLLIK